MRRILIILSIGTLSACAQATDAINSDATPAKLKAETAEYFSTSAYNVRVGNMRPGLLGTAYQARVSGHLYDCRYFKTAVTCSKA